MKIDIFDYELPKDLIAQYPLQKRSDSRLLVLYKNSGKIVHDYFYNIEKYINKNAIFIRNNSKVFKARLFGKFSDKEQNISEVFLLKNIKNNIWECKVRPGKKFHIGKCIYFYYKNKKIDNFYAKIRDINLDGNRIIKLYYEGDFWDMIDKYGNVPIPPYINNQITNLNDYQTLYAKNIGSVAAPTAGFHFDKYITEKLKNNGNSFLDLTLHVGAGTFEPVKTNDIKDHYMHSEFFSIDKNTVNKLNKAKGNKQIITIGTTTARALESSVDKTGQVLPLQKDTNIFIYPGYKWKFVDILLTNFHLPKSTLLMLVSSLAGIENIKEAYRQAIDKKYRFYSFGDSMLII